MGKRRRRFSSVRLVVSAPSNQELSIAGPFSIALSQDGKQLAYIDRSKLYLRPMDVMEAKELPGTAGALFAVFSPDGNWIGFSADGKLKKISTRPGSVPEVISDVAPAYGVTWGPDNNIYYTRASRDVLVKVPATGGAVQEVTTLDTARGENSHRWPQVLLEARPYSFTAWAGQGWHE